MENADVVVVGGGLAGLSCAMELTLAGRGVVLLEEREVLGGRTSSWEDGGMEVESGLHRMIGYYKELPRLLRLAGIDVNDIVHWEDEFEVRLPDGTPPAVMGASPLFRPLKTVGSAIGNNDFLSPMDKAGLARFFTAGLLQFAGDAESLDLQTVGQHARANGVSEEAIGRMLVPLTTGLFFISPDEYSAYAFFGLLAPGIRRFHRIRVGAFTGGMTDVMADPIAGAVRAKGGSVETGAPVDGLLMDGYRVNGVTIAGRELRARHVVLATGLGPAQDLLKGPFGEDAWFGPMLRLPTMPAVTAQFELDSPALPVDRTTFGPGTVLASFSEQSRTTFSNRPGRLSVILARQDEFINVKASRIVEKVVEDAAKLGMDIRPHITDYRVTRLPRDFYSLRPGNNRMRPRQATPIPGLTLAGDYTRQPMLATMEGAVISGRLAAEAVLKAG